jgi:adenylosuccinate synthase
MIIKTVTGAGYGDEGKGLMTDFFCNKLSENSKVLNVKVNGGAQAGHTVCRLDKENKQYKHWVFRQYGSGTFTGADTYLLDTFMVNFSELLKERQMLREIYKINTKLYIDKRCRVTLPSDVLMNRCVEDHRTNRHGSCGLGIYETFHRNNDFKAITIKDIIKEFLKGNQSEFENYLYQLANSYFEYRMSEIIGTDNINISAVEKDKMLHEDEKMNKEFVDSLVEIIKCDDIEFVENLDELIIKNKYNALVFECSQGLELDQYNERNFPHLTPSNTGLFDVAHAINDNKTLQNSEIENCFVTRSYKTKHGAGFFIEENNDIQKQFNLYDRTNHRNQYQGALKFGHLLFGRMKKLIFDQVDYFNNKISNTGCKTSISLSITHLDQTNECLVLDTGLVNYKDIRLDMFDKIYTSFGEKADDIIA